MKKLFTKKPLWAVVFAAAAIFAVTFVSCDNGSSDPASPSWVPLADIEGASEGDAVQWHHIETGVEKWYIATADGTLQPGGGYWAYTVVTTGVDVETAGEVAFAGAATTKVYKLTLITKAGESSTHYYVGKADGKIAVPGAAVGDKAVNITEMTTGGGYTIGADAAPLDGNGDNSAKIYKVSVITTGASGSLTEKYYQGGASGAITGAPSVAATACYKVTEMTTGGGYTIGAAAAPLDGNGDNSAKIYKVSVITTGASGSLTEKYYQGSTSGATGAPSVAATACYKVTEMTTGGGYTIGAGTAPLDGNSDNSAKIYKVSVITTGASGSLTEKYYQGGSSGAITGAPSVPATACYKVSADLASTVKTGVDNKIPTGQSAGDLVNVEEIVSTGTSNNGLKVADTDANVPGETGKKYLVSLAASVIQFKKF